MKSHITAAIVGFVVLVGQKTFNIVMTAGCASTKACTQTTTAKVANTSPTVLSVRSISSAQEVLLMKCLVAMQFTGSAFDNLQHMTPDAQSARRRPKLGNG
mmetsp:Transcript_12617/g.30132  ORF Transcript_12617/g.30132 Transcript_12617/m.30132 type:complete len:101 (+) Transcript_12617:873-1175(+)